MDEERRAKLEATTRWDPAEVEARIFAAWEAAGPSTRRRRAAPRRTSRSRSRRRTSPGRCTWATRSTAPSRTRSPGCGGCRGGMRCGSWAPITRGSQPRRWWRRSCARRAPHARSSAARPSSSGSGSGGASTALEIIEQYKRLGASCDYERERFTLDEGYVRAVHKVFVALYRKGLIYRDNYLVNWDPGNPLGDLRPRGRQSRGRRRPLRDRLPGRGLGRRVDDRHRAAGDDARRHRGRRAPGGRPLHALRRRPRDPAAGRPAAADHRRRARRPRVRDRCAEDHPRTRPGRLRHRPRATGSRRSR